MGRFNVSLISDSTVFGSLEIEAPDEAAVRTMVLQGRRRVYSSAGLILDIRDPDIIVEEIMETTCYQGC